MLLHFLPLQVNLLICIYRVFIVILDLFVIAVPTKKYEIQNKEKVFYV